MDLFNDPILAYENVRVIEQLYRNLPGDNVDYVGQQTAASEAVVLALGRPDPAELDEIRRELRADPVRYNEILGRIPAGRWGEPSDMGGAVVFLSSAASDYVQGFTIAVDGGWLSR